MKLHFLMFALIFGFHTEAFAQKDPTVTVRLIEGGESAAPAADCRRMLVGPGVNQPDPFLGYGGFVGWEAPLRLQDGT